MNLICMTVPEEPERLAPWLEGQLVGLHLGDLVAELTALHGPDSGLTLESILAGQEERVLSKGLAVLPTDVLRKLLRHPVRLLELQERVLTQGGEHWDRVQDADKELDRAFERGEQRFGITVPPEEVEEALRLLRAPWYRRPAVVSFATAAVVLIVIWAIKPFAPPDPGTGQPKSVAIAWGWAKPDAIPNDGTPKEYLNRLADAGQEWFKKKPDDAAGLSKRILEFRQGCSTLLLAEHRPLSEEDRKWLLGKCREWAGKFDQALASLEAGKSPVEVRDEMDTLANRLTKALRDRSGTL